MTIQMKFAMTKWCPFSRVAMVEGMAANRTIAMPDLGGKGGGYADIQEETRCIGNRCMAWVTERIEPGDNELGRCGLVK